ncbi:MAG: SPOR domain-containing protein [Bacteroidales bacterium]|nr:SPOR domain-containing protein [Bacteroidales bacterium]
MIQGVGGFEMDAVYMNDRVYISVTELFVYFKINHLSSRNFDSVSGFFLQEQNRYLINAIEKTIVVGSNNISPDETAFLRTPTGLYLRNDIFGKAFGLNLNFSFRTLSLELKTNLELPVIKELRLEQMRKNVSRLKGEVTVDTTLKRNYHLFAGGMADWSVIATQNSGGTSDTRTSLALGAELLGGETNILLNYSSRIGFDERQQQYRWRWANNDAKLVRQVVAGKIQPRSIASIYAPVIGAYATNSPTTFRKSFGSYILSDYTEAGWTVELYINNVIVDFTTADAKGFFSFDVPLVYGTSQMTLKFFGPWGEERIREQTINVPYNFLPKGSVEYSASSGVVKDTSNALYSRAEAGVGVNRNFTVGGGIEYLSSIKTGSTIPFLNTSVRFFRNFLFTGEYAHGVKTRGLLNYRLPSNLVLELDYTKYVHGQMAISYNYLEERKASLSLPLRIGEFRSFARMSFKQNVLEQTTYSTSEILLSTYIAGVSANVSGFANWISDGNPYVYSNIALGFKLGRYTNFRPQAQFDVTNKKLISLKAELERSFSQKAFLTLSYEENIRSAYRSIEVSFRYELPFAQTSTSARLANGRLISSESARGSFAFGSGNGYIHVDNRSIVGRGGITITPFLDINHNEKRDPDEAIAQGLNLRLNGGRILVHPEDSLIRIMELEPYASYLLELDDNSFENIAWQLTNKTLSVNIDPNQFKKIDIPVKVMGEVNGMVYLRSGNSVKGQNRIVVNFYDSKGKFVMRSMTESDGYYNYLGFAPGSYTAMVDTAQLARLGLIAEPVKINFEIKPSSIGDIVDDASFTLTKTETVKSETSGLGLESEKNPEPAKIADVQPEKAIEGQTLLKKEHEHIQKEPITEITGLVEVISGNIKPEAGPYFVQAGAFDIPENAENLAEILCRLSESRCGIIRMENTYKVRFGYFPDLQSAEKCMNQIVAGGYPCFTGEAKRLDK